MLWPDFGGEVLIRGFGEHTGQMVDTASRWVRDGIITLSPGDYTFPLDGPYANPTGELGPVGIPFARVVAWSGGVSDFGFACAVHNTTEFPRFQILMADDEGRFPGDPGCECAKFQLKGLPS